MTAMVQTEQPDAAAASPDSPETPRRPSLSPSRAADFKTCALLYRFRTIDRLPERKSRAAVRGTLVHSVLERLYDLPPAERTVAGALELLEPAWAELRDEPGIAELFGAAQDDGAETDLNAPESVQAWLASAGTLVERYFTLEDPTRIQPHGREELVEVTLPDGLLLRGFVDRLDVARNGARGVRGQGPVPDEVLRAGAVAHPGRGGQPAEAALPRRRRRPDLRPRRAGARPVRAHAAGDLGRHRAGGPDR
jgi:putative RecB family exonuclease